MFNLNQITKDLKIEGVNQLIVNKFSSDSKQIEKICEFAFKQKGKQLRPILTYLIAKTAGIKSIPEQTPIELTTVAAGIELIHFATIMHDDIIDRSDLRRNQPSVFHEFGTNDGIITGDYLLVKAFGLCGQLDRRIVTATEVACTRLTEGEIMETPLSLADHTIQSYLDIAAKKTAALFHLAAESAAIIAGCQDSTIKLFADFAENMGIAFQILDDILDVNAEVQSFGKKVGTDIRERKPSIVNLLWLESADPKSAILKTTHEINDAELADLIQSIMQTNVIAKAQKFANKYSEAAKDCLTKAIEDIDHDKESYQILIDLLDFVISRSK